MIWKQMLRPTAMLLSLSLAVAACGPVMMVSRESPREAADLSGNWNDTDSREVAEAMIFDSLSSGWIDRFREAKGKNPVVVTYGVKNRTAEHINTSTFVKNLERAFLRSGRVGLVAGEDQRRSLRGERGDQQLGFTATPAQLGKEVGADYVLMGELSAIEDHLGGRSVIFYQANLELISVETSQKVWIGEHQIKKFVSRAPVRLF